MADRNRMSQTITIEDTPVTECQDSVLAALLAAGFAEGDQTTNVAQGVNHLVWIYGRAAHVQVVIEIDPGAFIKVTAVRLR